MDGTPDDCPATVESFVEAYEHAYYHDVVVEYEPGSRLASYELSGSVTGGPRERGEGRELAYAGSGGAYRPTLLVGTTTTAVPGGADVVPVADVDGTTVELSVTASDFHGDYSWSARYYPPGHEPVTVIIHPDTNQSP